MYTRRLRVSLVCVSVAAWRPGWSFCCFVSCALVVLVGCCAVVLSRCLLAFYAGCLHFGTLLRGWLAVLVFDFSSVFLSLSPTAKTDSNTTFFQQLAKSVVHLTSAVCTTAPQWSAFLMTSDDDQSTNSTNRNRVAFCKLPPGGTNNKYLLLVVLQYELVVHRLVVACDCEADTPILLASINPSIHSSILCVSSLHPTQARVSYLYSCTSIATSRTQGRHSTCTGCVGVVDQ
jgi:hypothetical protein